MSELLREIELREYQATCARAADLGGADLIAFSPPYCDARTYDGIRAWGDAEYAALGDACLIGVKPGGHVLINVDAPVRDWRGIGSERGLHPFRIAIDWAERVGFRFVERIAFARFGNPGAYVGRFRNDWEPLLWFQKPGADGFFDKTPIAEKASSEWKGKRAISRKADGTMYGRSASGWAVDAGMRHRGTLWDYGHVGRCHSGSTDLEAADHPARWPARLARDIVTCFSPPGGLVCDPFVGAGTTAVACAEQGRSFVGGDISERWVNEARLQVGYVNLSLFAADAVAP